MKLYVLTDLLQYFPAGWWDARPPPCPPPRFSPNWPCVSFVTVLPGGVVGRSAAPVAPHHTPLLPGLVFAVLLGLLLGVCLGFTLLALYVFNTRR